MFSVHQNGSFLLFLLLLFFDAMQKNCLCSTTEGDGGQTRLSVFGNIYRETTTTTWCHTSKVKFCQKNTVMPNSNWKRATLFFFNFFYFFFSFVFLTAFIKIRKLIQSKAERERKKSVSRSRVNTVLKFIESFFFQSIHSPQKKKRI